MKKFTLLIFMLMTFLVHGQTQSDQASVLQQCIDFPELQDLFPKDANGNHLPVMIMQHAISFDEGIQIQKFGQPVQFITKSQASQMNMKAYFVFQSFNISETEARVDFSFDYDRDTESPKRVRVHLKLQKTGDVWSITESKS